MKNKVLILLGSCIALLGGLRAEDCAHLSLIMMIEPALPRDGSQLARCYLGVEAIEVDGYRFDEEAMAPRMHEWMWVTIDGQERLLEFHPEIPHHWGIWMELPRTAFMDVGDRFVVPLRDLRRIAPMGLPLVPSMRDSLLATAALVGYFWSGDGL